MSLSKTFPLIFILGFSSCDFSTRIDTAAVVKEMKAKQVKRVLPEQIVNQVDTWGLGVQKEIEKKLNEKSSIDVAAIQKKYGISILVGKPMDLKGQVGDKKIKEILDALDYSQSIQQEVPPSIQKNANGDSLFYIFTHPVVHTVILGFSKVRVIQEMDRPLIK
jgi:hypothetical protein